VGRRGHVGHAHPLRSGTILIWREALGVPVSGVDARLVPESCRWLGLRDNSGRRWGAGRLESCQNSVAATWRDRGRLRRAVVWPYGGEVAEPGDVVSLAEAGGLPLVLVISSVRGSATWPDAARGRPVADRRQLDVRVQMGRDPLPDLTVGL
jgi:hypothetical protein